MKEGFVEVKVVHHELKNGDVSFNANKILEKLDGLKTDIAAFSQLNLIGNHAKDSMLREDFLDSVEKNILKIVEKTSYKGLFTIGAPLRINQVLYNVLVVVLNNEIIGIIPKKNITKEEVRYFKPWDQESKVVSVLDKEVLCGDIIFSHNELKLGFELGYEANLMQPRSDLLAKSGANLIINAGEEPRTAVSGGKLKGRVQEHARRQMSAYIYVGPSRHESGSDVVYTDQTMTSECGLRTRCNCFEPVGTEMTWNIDITGINYRRRKEGFEIEEGLIDFYEMEIDLPETEPKLKDIKQNPFLQEFQDDHYPNVFNLLVQSTKNKLKSLPKNLQKIILGISGGADSVLAILVAARAIKELGLPSQNLIAVSLPSENSTSKSKARAMTISRKLKTNFLLIPIDNELKAHLESIEHKDKDTTYENAQARIRTLVLMDLANKSGAIMLGPSDLSEIALGFTTYNGDASSMFAINHSMPKTVVLAMIDYLSKTEYKEIHDLLQEVVKTKPSPELLKDQVAEDTLGLYEINDFILYYFVASGWGKKQLVYALTKVYSLSVDEASTYVNRFIKRFHQNQFKRQVMPEGPRVMEFSLEPRNDFKLSGDNEIENE